MEYTKESESPDNYHLWCGLSALSASVRRNIWIDQNLYSLYANLYVALVGPPGRTAKSTALYLSRGLLGNVPNVKLGPDSVTREQLINAMEKSKLGNQCALTIYSTEFSSLIGPSGILMIQLLLDLYDCNYSDSKKGWTYETKNKGENKLINPYLSGLFCTTPTYLAEAIPDNIVGHGFTSRIIFVHEEFERLVNPRPKPMDIGLATALVEDLRHINHISGEFKWDDSEGDIEDPVDKQVKLVSQFTYDNFYRSLYKDLPKDHRLEGYHWRKKIHVLKVAMLLSLADSDSLVLKRQDIETAVQLLHNLEHNMARVFSAVGKYDHAVEAERVGSYIKAHGAKGVPAGDVYTKFYHLGSEELGKILVLLQRMRTIRVAGSGDKETFFSSGALPWE